MTPEIADRFMKFVFPEPNTGCWLWDGNTDKLGRGRFNISGNKHQAHIVAHELFVGPAPQTKKHLIAQTCGVHACVNPSHLAIKRAGKEPKPKVPRNDRAAIEAFLAEHEVTQCPPRYAAGLSPMEDRFGAQFIFVPSMAEIINRSATSASKRNTQNSMGKTGITS